MANVKGFAAWAPHGKSRERLREVQAVMAEGREDWPLSQRYWLYRLMGRFGWEKFDEYDAARYRKDHGRKNPPREPYNLNRILDRGRRSGVIPWDAVVATRGMRLEPPVSAFPEELADYIEQVVREEQFGRQDGQVRRIVLWMETEGLAPTMERTAFKFGSPVLAGKGFDVIGRKYEFARIVAACGDVLILHCGDLDRSGHSVQSALNADLSAFIRDMGGKVEVERIALTEEQVRTYGLPFVEVDEGLNAGNHGAGYGSRIECQLEAMDIGDIRSIVEDAFERHLDMELYRRRVALEPTQREQALRLVIERNRSSL